MDKFFDLAKDSLSFIHRKYRERQNRHLATDAMASKMQDFIYNDGYTENLLTKLHAFLYEKNIQYLLQKCPYEIDDNNDSVKMITNCFQREFSGVLLPDFSFNGCLLNGIKMYRRYIQIDPAEATRTLLDHARKHSKVIPTAPVLAVSTLPQPSNRIISKHPPITFPHYIERRETAYQIIKAIEEYKKVTLFGIGGSGKSSTAKEVFKIADNIYKNRAWIHFRQIDFDYSVFLHTFATEINLNSTEELDDSEIENCITSFISKYNSELLIVLDNINIDENEEISTFLGKLQCDILVTTRKKEFGSFYPITLPQMSEQDCKRLYTNICSVQSNDEPLLLKLIQRAGYLPMLVELLAKTQRQSMNSLDWINRRLDEYSFNLGQSISVTALYDEKHLNRTLIDHLSSVFAIHDELDQLSKWIIKSIAVFPDTLIPSALFVSMIGEDSLLYKNTLREIERLGWIEIVETSGEFFVSMHNVIREMTCLQFIPNHSEHEYLIESIIALIDGHFSAFEITDGCEIMFPLCERILALFDDTSSDLIFMRFNLAKLYMELAMYYKASIHFCKVKMYSMKLNNRSNEDMIYILCELSRSYIADGYPKNAEMCMVEADKYLSETTPVGLRAEMLCINALILESMGKYQRAYNYYKKAESLVTDDDDVELYERLATICYYLNFDNEALAFCRKVILLLVKHGADINSWAYGSVYEVMTSVYQQKEELGEALYYAKESLRIATESFGLVHSHTETAFNNLGGAFLLIPNYKRAFECYEKSIEIARQIRTGNHRHTGNDYFNYAQALFSAGHYNRALGALNEAIQQYRDLDKSTYESVYARLLSLKCEIITLNPHRNDKILARINELHKDVFEYNEVARLIPIIRKDFYYISFEIYATWGMKEEALRSLDGVIEYTTFKDPKEIFYMISEDIMNWSVKELWQQADFTQPSIHLIRMANEFTR